MVRLVVVSDCDMRKPPGKIGGLQGHLIISYSDELVPALRAAARDCHKFGKSQQARDCCYGSWARTVTVPGATSVKPASRTATTRRRRHAFRGSSPGWRFAQVRSGGV